MSTDIDPAIQAAHAAIDAIAPDWCRLFRATTPDDAPVLRDRSTTLYSPCYIAAFRHVDVVEAEDWRRLVDAFPVEAATVVIRITDGHNVTRSLWVGSIGVSYTLRPGRPGYGAAVREALEAEAARAAEVTP